ncbi:MAG: hypothetical protein V5A57_01615 [Candidatus Paceibacterota bacterium]
MIVASPILLGAVTIAFISFDFVFLEHSTAFVKERPREETLSFIFKAKEKIP